MMSRLNARRSMDAASALHARSTRSRQESPRIPLSVEATRIGNRSSVSRWYMQSAHLKWTIRYQRVFSLRLSKPLSPPELPLPERNSSAEYQRSRMPACLSALCCKCELTNVHTKRVHKRGPFLSHQRDKILHIVHNSCRYQYR